MRRCAVIGALPVAAASAAVLSADGSSSSSSSASSRGAELLHQPSGCGGGATKPVTDKTFKAEVLQSTKTVLVDYRAKWYGPAR